MSSPGPALPAAAQLSASDTHLLRDVFVRVDSDGDGLISADDIIRFVASHHPHHRLTPALTRSFVQLADADRDGFLDVFEFLGAHAPGCPGIIPAEAVAAVAGAVRNALTDNELDELQIAFRVFDADGDSQLSEAELTALLRCERALRNAQERRRRHRARLRSAAGSSLAASASTVFGMASAAATATGGGGGDSSGSSIAVDDSAVAWILARAARGYCSDGAGEADAGGDFNLSSFIRVSQETEILLPHAAAFHVPLALKIKRCYDEADALTKQQQDEQEDVFEVEGDDKAADSAFIHLLKVVTGTHATAEHAEKTADPAVDRRQRVEDAADIIAEEVFGGVVSGSGASSGGAAAAAAVSRLIAEALVREVELLGDDWKSSGVASPVDGLLRRYPGEQQPEEEEDAAAVSDLDGKKRRGHGSSSSSSSAWLSSMWVALRIFDSLDSRGKHLLGPAELGFLSSSASVLEVIRHHDYDGDGALGFADFLAALSASPPLLPRAVVEACELYLGFLASSVQATALARVLVKFPKQPAAFAAALDTHLDVVGGMTPLLRRRRNAQARVASGEHDDVDADAEDDDLSLYAVKQRMQRCYTRDTILLLATEGWGVDEPVEQELAVAAFQQLLRSDTTALMQFATLLTSKVLSVPNVAMLCMSQQFERSAFYTAAAVSLPQQAEDDSEGDDSDFFRPFCPFSLLANLLLPQGPDGMSATGSSPSMLWGTMPLARSAMQSEDDAGSPASPQEPRVPSSLRAAFEALDVNHRSALDPEVVVPIAVRRLLAAHTHQGSSSRFDLRIVNRLVAALFRALDRDGDDRLSLAEFHRAVTGPLILFSEVDVAAAAAHTRAHSLQVMQQGGAEEAGGDATPDDAASSCSVESQPAAAAAPAVAATAADAPPPAPIGPPQQHLLQPQQQHVVLPPSSRPSTGSHNSTPEPRGLPQSDIAYINNLFHTIDAKHDGFIDLDELLAGGATAHVLLGDVKGKWTAEQRAAAARGLLEQGDLDGDGVLSEAEFLSCFIRGITHVPPAAKRHIVHGGSASNASSDNSGGGVAAHGRPAGASKSGRRSKGTLAKRTSSPSLAASTDSSAAAAAAASSSSAIKSASVKAGSASASSTSPEKIETLRYLFSYIDRNRNGLISKDELRLLLSEFLHTHFQNDHERLVQFTDEMMHEISSGSFEQQHEQDGQQAATATAADEFTFEQFVAAFERNPDLMRVSADAVRERIQRTEAELERLLREEDLRRIAKVFVSLDADGNGVLDFDEVHDELFDLIKTQYPHWSAVDVERTVRAIFETADINSDGELSFEEFINTFVNKHYSLSGFIDSRAARFRRDLTAEEVAELRSLFSFMDEDNDGRVTAAELESLVGAALRETDNDDPATIAAIVDSVLAIADTNRDGHVDLREFIAAYEQDSQLLDIPIMAAAARRDAADKKMQELLCKHDLRDIAKVFLMIDRNGDGEISKAELESEIAAQLRRLHPDWAPPRVREAIDTVLDAADWDHESGTLSLDAFIEAFVQGHYLLPPGSVQDVVATFTRKLSAEEVGQLVGVFNSIDANADGTISKAELERALVAAVGRDAAEAVSKVIMTVADENFDGVLSIGEFLKCYQLDSGLLTVPISSMSVTTLGHIAERIIPKQGLRRLGRMFHLLDLDGDGYLTPGELAEGLRRYQRRRSSGTAGDEASDPQLQMGASTGTSVAALLSPTGATSPMSPATRERRQLENVARAKVLSADLDGDGKLSLDEWIASYANAGCDAAMILPWVVIDTECASPLAGTPKQMSWTERTRVADEMRDGISRLSTAEGAETEQQADDIPLVPELQPEQEEQQQQPQPSTKRVPVPPATAAVSSVAPRPASAPKPTPTPPAAPPTSGAPPQSSRARRFQQPALSSSSSPHGVKAAVAVNSMEQPEMRRLFDSLQPSDSGDGEPTVDAKAARQLFVSLENFGLEPSARQVDMIFGPVVRNGRINFNGWCMLMLKRFTL